MVLFDSHISENLRSRENFRVVWVSFRWYHQRMDFFLSLCSTFCGVSITPWLVVLNGYGDSRRHSNSPHLPGRERRGETNELLSNTLSKLRIDPILVTCLPWIVIRGWAYTDQFKTIHLSHLLAARQVSFSRTYGLCGGGMGTLIEIGMVTKITGTGCWGGTTLSTTGR